MSKTAQSQRGAPSAGAGSARVPVSTPRRQAKPRFITHHHPGALARVEITDDAHRRRVSALVSNKIGYHAASRYHNSYPVTILAQLRNELREEFPEGDAFGDGVIGVIDENMAARRENAEKNLERGRVEFFDIPVLFKEGDEVVAQLDGELIAGIVSSVVHEIHWMGIQFYKVQLRVYHNVTGELAEGMFTVRIFDWEETVEIGTLPLRALTAELREQLTKRGEWFRDLTSRASYVSYTGQLVKNSWWSSKSYRADGRAMVDCQSFKQIDNNQHENEVRAAGISNDEDRYYGDDGKHEQINIPDDALWRCFPFVYGFSFAAKQWGRFSVSGLRPITWRDDAFDKLVLDDADKELIRALVEHQTGTFADIIEGKGGGVIFLLHGPPGQGKTLTAEAIAELLRRPLYSISIGELGTEPDQLESRLREVLDIATVWNAVVLMDEADIFLEARDERDIVRNAMVGVFLRLLEYHQGVLFLTTNRVKRIDTAFYSRISVALHFKEGGSDKRRKIWENLLAAARIGGLNPDELAAFELNGRQIKNVIRLSQTLAKARGCTIDFELVKQVVDRTTNFTHEVTEK